MRWKVPRIARRIAVVAVVLLAIAITTAWRLPVLRAADARGGSCSGWLSVSRTFGSRGIELIHVGNRNQRVRLTTALDDRPAWSPSGTEVAFRRIFGSIDRVLVYQVSGFGVKTRLGTSLASFGGADPSWSHSGDRIAFVRPDGLYVFDVRTHVVRLVRRLALPAQPSWTSDDRNIVVALGGGLARFELTRKVQKQLTESPYDADPDVAADGSLFFDRLVFGRLRPKSASRVFRLGSEGGIRSVTTGYSPAYNDRTKCLAFARDADGPTGKPRSRVLVRSERGSELDVTLSSESVDTPAWR